MKCRHVLSLLGPNGCDKGTTSRYLSAMGAHVEVTSDVLEAYKDQHPPAAEAIHHYKTVLKRNVPDQVVVDAESRVQQLHRGTQRVAGESVTRAIDRTIERPGFFAGASGTSERSTTPSPTAGTGPTDSPLPIACPPS